ncbi:MAG TPA: site-specific integrase [Actinomycetota bacterium]|jgi:integrase|nr:site-specific integrase [Actinomycetota bacterium]
MADIRKKHDRAWLVRWREKGKQRYRQFKTQAEAEDFRRSVEPLPKAIRDVPGIPGWGDAPPLPAADDAYSVAGYARRMNEADRDLRSTTRTEYEGRIRHHLDGTTLGQMDIRHVMPEDVAEWWANLHDKKTGEPAGPGVRRNAVKMIARVFNRAVFVGDIEVSPVKRVPEIKRPRVRKKDNALTVAQLERLADAAAKGDGRTEQTQRRDRLIVLVMGFGGLRASEVGGLRIDDIRRNGQRCRLRVSRAVVREAGETYITDLKTDAARRLVPIPCSVADELEAYVRDYDVDGPIFTQESGKLMIRNNIAGVVGRAAKRASLQGVHAHGLRHTAASIAVQAGANPEALRAMLGHTDVRITLQTYTHLWDWGADEIADTMEHLREQYRRGS